jgi:HlyD family secretion protein
VAEVLVHEGDLVQQYQLLIRLDDREQRAAVAEAEAGLQAAQAQLAKLNAGPREQEVVAADAAVKIAQANLTRITDGTPDPLVSALDQSVARTIAEEDLRRAQAELDLLQSGARPEDIAIAEAAVAEADAMLQQKRLALAATEIRAPFSGMIASLKLEVGQQLELLAPVVQIADLTDWQIESDQLDEWGVVNVRVGDEVKITFDAIPSLTLTGTLTHIGPAGMYEDDGVTYAMIVKPAAHDPRVYWNMTAQIVFDAAR